MVLGSSPVAVTSSTIALEEISLDLHHHVARLAWLIQEYIFLGKKQSGPPLKTQ